MELEGGSMNQNPYNAWIKIMREQGSTNNPPYISVVEVVSIDPVLVSLNGVQLDKDDLLIADTLVGNMVVGDQLAALPAEGKQKIIILCRVVSLP